MRYGNIDYRKYYCTNCGLVAMVPVGETDNGLCDLCTPASPIQRAVIRACIKLGDVDAFGVNVEGADEVIQRLQDAGFAVVPVDHEADTAASALRQEFKALEQSFMVLKDQYSELAQAIGVEADAFWGDPLEDHAGVMAKAKLLKCVLTASQWARRHA